MHELSPCTSGYDPTERREPGVRGRRSEDEDPDNGEGERSRTRLLLNIQNDGKEAAIEDK
jgi:hypothetical protein